MACGVGPGVADMLMLSQRRLQLGDERLRSKHKPLDLCRQLSQVTGNELISSDQNKQSSVRSREEGDMELRLDEQEC